MAERRLLWLAAMVLLWAAAILAKLVHLQVIDHEKYLAKARAHQEILVEIPAPRGTIYDRTGQPLAMSVPVKSVFVNPLLVPDLEVAARILSGVMGLDRAALYGKLRWAYDHDKGFQWIKRRVSAEEGRRLGSLPLEWIKYQEESRRQYPGGGTAAHLLGSVDFEERGNAGIEKSLDGDLRGIAGRTRVLTDVHRRGIESRPAAEARAGLALTLSIDQRIQFVAEGALAAAVQEAGAKTGSVVVLDPHTGDVLAMASYPGYDPGQPPPPDEIPAARFNHAVSVPFEPGSVFKVITVAAALETTTLSPESPIDCGRGALTVYGRTIHEAKNFYGTIPMAMVLAKSSNIGAIKIGLRVGQERMHEYVRRFGFGQRSGIALPAESAGKVRKTAHWTKTSLHSVSMGQEISTTTLQLAQAGAVIANGGLLVKPRLVIRRGNQGVPVEPPRRVIRPETAIAMRRMMEGVVLHGTGTRARLAGYTSGGKTGSAQIFDVKTNRFTHSYNASYMGFAPVTNPAIVVVVTINGTHGSGGFGGAVAAPVFRVVAGEALRVLDVPKDLPEQGAVEVAQAGEDELNDLAIAQIGPLRESVLEEAAAEDDASAAPAVVVGPRAPNFQGKTMRAVLEEAFTAGVEVLPAGSGIARAQDPRPGAMLRPGERVRVQFAR